MTDSDTFAARAAELRARTEDLGTQVARRANAVEATARRAAAVTATAASPDGSVRATVDATGLLTELEIAPDALARTTAAELSRLVTGTTRAAAARAREQVRGLYAGLVDEGVIAGVPALLPPPVAAPPRPPRPVRAQPDEQPVRGYQRDAW